MTENEYKKAKEKIWKKYKKVMETDYARWYPKNMKMICEQMANELIALEVEYCK